MRRLAGIVLAANLAWPALAIAQSLAVTTADGRTTTLTAAAMAGLPRAKASLTEGGGAHVYEGPTLSHVLRVAGAPMGQRLHGDPLRAYVLVTGGDGFSAVYSLAEADKDFHDDLVVLADRKDGAPLDSKHGPWRVVSSGDKKGWRAVYNVVRIEVRSAKP